VCAMKAEDAERLRRWRRRGFYSENALVKLLQKNGYYAVRVPVSNPSLSPLPDIIARREEHVYAFEVKNAGYYAYFPRQQIQKLFEFLHEFVPVERQYKHPILAAHLGKRWIFREVNWQLWKEGKLLEQERIVKRDIGNFKLGMDKEGEKASLPVPDVDLTST
jgi:Holliday junction resolvase